MQTPDPAGGLRVPLGGVPGALLVPDQDVPERGRVEQRVVGRQDRAARDAEDDLGADRLERADERLALRSRQPLVMSATYVVDLARSQKLLVRCTGASAATGSRRAR